MILLSASPPLSGADGVTARWSHLKVIHILETFVLWQCMYRVHLKFLSCKLAEIFPNKPWLAGMAKCDQTVWFMPEAGGHLTSLPSNKHELHGKLHTRRELIGLLCLWHQINEHSNIRMIIYLIPTSEKRTNIDDHLKNVLVPRGGGRGRCNALLTVSPQYIILMLK